MRGLFCFEDVVGEGEDAFDVGVVVRGVKLRGGHVSFDKRVGCVNQSCYCCVWGGGERGSGRGVVGA